MVESLLRQIKCEKLPQHIAIIMDGNGRWAKKHHLPRIMGHRAGVEAIREIVRICAELKIKILSLFAFSSENWQRPRSEVQALMNLLEEHLDKELAELKKNNVQIRFTGRTDELPKGVQVKLKNAIDETKKNSGLILNLVLNYGGRREIVDAVNKILQEGGEEVTEEKFCNYLYSPDLSDPDLLIRTSGEYRISNFLLWQIAYTELYTTPVLWPDFCKDDLYRAIIEYQYRERRFGRL